MKLKTVTVIVMDSVGVGELPDAADFGDVGAHTLNHTLGYMRDQGEALELPNFQRLGLGNIDTISEIAESAAPLASYGRMAELSPGKDSSTGHWEFMGVVLEQPFQTFPPAYPSFPESVMAQFSEAIGRGYLGNYAASGTAIIEELGAEHLATGKPIIYTSADSVFQIACHTEVVSLETLYAWCEIARELMRGEHAVARIIARPFEDAPTVEAMDEDAVGESKPRFQRIGAARKDFSLSPPHDTVLDAINKAGLDVIGIGKIPALYNYQGFTQVIKSKDNMDGVDKTLEAMRQQPHGFIFCNLVEFDSKYGHRRDPAGYARALQDLDKRLPALLEAVGEDGILIFTSDHGNDPTWQGNDHTREHALWLSYQPNRAAQALGTRASFADLGATVAALLGVDWQGAGTSVDL